jgi:hypothetical protein
MQTISVTPAMEAARNWYANGRGVLFAAVPVPVERVLGATAVNVVDMSD